MLNKWWLRSLVARFAGSNAPRNRRRTQRLAHRPGLELLEDRAMPAVVAWDLMAQTLSVTASGGDSEPVVVSTQQTATGRFVTVNGQQTPVLANQLVELDVIGDATSANNIDLAG